jgi:hypothetical protein
MRHTGYFEKNFARLYHGYPVVHRGLAPTHPSFGRFLADRLIREYPNPDLPSALKMARYGYAGSLDLPSGDP